MDIQQDAQEEEYVSERDKQIITKFKNKILKEFLPCFMLKQFEEAGEQNIFYESFGQSQRLSDVLIGHSRVRKLPHDARDGRAADLLAEGLLDVLQRTLELRLVPRDQELPFWFSLDDSLIEAAGLYQFQTSS